MKKEAQTNLGTILYEENFWTGKRKISLNGKELVRVNKKTFVIENGGDKAEITVDGNMFKGVKLCSSLLSEPIIVTEPMTVLDYVFFALPIVPSVLFGLVGGLIGGLTAGVSLAVVPKAKPLWLKILLGVEFTIVGGLVSFLTAYAVGKLIL